MCKLIGRGLFTLVQHAQSVPELRAFWAGGAEAGLKQPDRGCRSQGVRHPARQAALQERERNPVTEPIPPILGMFDNVREPLYAFLRTYLPERPIGLSGGAQTAREIPIMVGDQGN